MLYRYFSLFNKTCLLLLILNSNHHMKANVKQQGGDLVIENLEVIWLLVFALHHIRYRAW